MPDSNLDFESAEGCLGLKTRLFKHMLETMGNIRGKRILDLGCGDGVFSRMMVQRGAFVLGIDKNRRFIARAQSKTMANIEFVRADAAVFKTRPVFDFATAFFLLNELPIESLVEVLKKVRGALKARGRFVFVVPHPAFAYAEQTPLVERREIKQSDYFRNGMPYEVRFLVGKNDKLKMIDHHFSLGFLVNSLYQSGLTLQRIRELTYGTFDYEVSLPFYLLAEAIRK